MTHRIRFLLAAVIVGLSVTPTASPHVTYEQITVATSSIGITATITNPTGYPQQNTCVLRLETAQVRYRTDGTAPSSTVGTPLEIGDVLVITTNEDARRVRFIRTGATSGLLNAECYR